eukprot:347542_1
MDCNLYHFICFYLTVTMTIFTDCAVYLNPYFSDFMVLQTNAQSGYRSFIYGTADPFEPIHITGNISGGNFFTTADKNGNWFIETNPGGGSKLVSFTVFGTNNSVTVSNIVYGDVFLCIGDQNMLLPMNNIYNATAEIEKSSKYPSIKIATLHTINSNKPSYAFPVSKFSGWTQANPKTVGTFSAMCYLSAQKLLDIYGNGRNMALLQIAINKSTLNCFASENALKQANKQCVNIPSMTSAICNDSTLYNGMIYPFIYNSYRSFIFNVGTNDINNENSYYECLLGIIINDCRDISLVEIHHLPLCNYRVSV